MSPQVSCHPLGGGEVCSHLSDWQVWDLARVLLGRREGRGETKGLSSWHRSLERLLGVFQWQGWLLGS